MHLVTQNLLQSYCKGVLLYVLSPITQIFKSLQNDPSSQSESSMHTNCRLIAALRRLAQIFQGLQDFPVLQSSSVIQPVFPASSIEVRGTMAIHVIATANLEPFSILDLKKRQRHRVNLPPSDPPPPPSIERVTQTKIYKL